MFSLLGPITTLLLASTICQALPDLHKQMSPEQLHSVFHVDTHDAVPDYELVQLLHHTPHASLQRKRRSIGESLGNPTPLPPHHVKKDLSKNAYYSELKQQAAAGGSNHLFGSDVSAIKSHNVSFSAFGQHMNLTLRATQGLFKGAPHELRMWSVGSEPNATHGLDMQEILNEEHHKHEIGEVFQDEQNMAAILMRRHMETGDLIMEGSIGHDLVIKPLPHELSNNKEQAQHIIYKREASATDDQLSDFAFMEPDDLLASEKLERMQRRQSRRRRSSGNSPDFEDLNDEDEGALDTEAEAAEPQTSESRVRPRRQAPYVIYPEVLVIVDYDGYRLHGGDNLQVKRYFISFWNGVDLRYRLLKGPRIRISIAGIIISRGRDATPYLERNRVGRDAIDSAAALTDMGKYLFRERRLPVYDIAVAITKLDMCRRTSAYGECNRGTAGFAYVGGACVVNKRLEKVNSVAIIEDTGGFSGIIVAAHEVGHLLGAVHDGSPPPSYLGGPGAQRCRWEDGYIMSDLRHTERGFRWSACTVQSFHHFLNGDTATCLHNAPHEDSALGRSLPGTLLSLDAQCRRDRGTYACFKDERVCAQLFCFDAQTGYCVAYRPAAEGSACGNGYHCLDGRCTPLPSNIIPDYGNNYRLVYNATTNSNNSGSNSNNNNGAKEHNSNNNNGEEANNKRQLQQQQQQQVDEENEANAGIEINEAIERQKRKFLIQQQQQQQPRHLTTLQQQQQQLATPTTSTATATTTAAKATPMPTTTTTSTSKSKPTTSSIFDVYFKKLQALHLPTLDGAVTATTTSVSTSVSSSATKQQQQQPQQQQQHFDGSPFLKRTLNRSSIIAYKKNSNKISSNSHNYSPQQQQQQQQQQQHQALRQQQQHQLTSPSYVTNYIGDNTNNLPSVLDNESSTTTTTITTAIQQQQHQQQQQSTNGTATPKKPKIKTQKLIRRTRVM